ncbi:MAG: twin-arginine translocase TatA/TatE family subunit [Candidatus Palauibacterales bacterium]|nr:twin-arginine translocase TatA/TatE family subunit [Candidatus Palauibacterales bacterium]
MGIGNLGLTEILVLAVLVLVFFGPQRLPEIARGLGKAMREFKKGMNEVQREFEELERQQRESRSEEERARSRKSRPQAGEKVRPPGQAGEEADDGIPTFGGGRQGEEAGQGTAGQAPEPVDRPEAREADAAGTAGDDGGAEPAQEEGESAPPGEVGSDPDAGATTGADDEDDVEEEKRDG